MYFEKQTLSVILVLLLVMVTLFLSCHLVTLIPGKTMYFWLNIDNQGCNRNVLVCTFGN